MPFISLLIISSQQVAVVRKMVNASRSMRCYLKQTSGSPLIQFSSSSVKNDDTGDGGGIPVFKFWSVSSVGMSYAVQFYCAYIVLGLLKSITCASI